MTLLYTEGFDWIVESPSAALNLDAWLNYKAIRYTSVLGNVGGANTILTGNDPNLHGVFGYNSSSSGTGGFLVVGLTEPADAPDDVMVYGSLVNLGAFGSTIDGSSIISFREACSPSGTLLEYEHIDLRRSNSGNGVIRVLTGTGLVDRGNFTLPTGVWFFLEVKVRIHDTLGYVIVRRDGVEIFRVENIDTYNAQTGTIGVVNEVVLMWKRVAHNANGTPTHMDDIYILNEKGSVNNDFLGNVHIRAIQLTGAGDLTEWTPSAGANWECVDDPPSTGTNYIVPNLADYVTASVDGTRDSYVYEDIPDVTNLTIKAVMVVNTCTKTDTGARSIRGIAKDGANVVTSPDRGVYYGSQGGTKMAMCPLDVAPDGGAWTRAKVNSAQFGMEIRP